MDHSQMLTQLETMIGNRTLVGSVTRLILLMNLRAPTNLIRLEMNLLERKYETEMQAIEKVDIGPNPVNIRICPFIEE